MKTKNAYSITKYQVRKLQENTTHNQKHTVRKILFVRLYNHQSKSNNINSNEITSHHITSHNITLR